MNNQAEIITYSDGRQIYVDKHTKFLDSMIGMMTHEIFILKNMKLKDVEKKLEETEKHLKEYTEIIIRYILHY